MTTLTTITAKNLARKALSRAIENIKALDAGTYTGLDYSGMRIIGARWTLTFRLCYAVRAYNRTHGTSVDYMDVARQYKLNVI